MKFIKVALYLIVTAIGIGNIFIGSETFGVVIPTNPDLNHLTQKEVSTPHGQELILGGAFLVLAGVMLTATELVPEDGIDAPATPPSPFAQLQYVPSTPATVASQELEESFTPVTSAELEMELKDEVWDGVDSAELDATFQQLSSFHSNTRQTT
jgi:hypothetical protein